MSGIYLTADLHLGHRKLAELRGFDSVEEHDRIVTDSLYWGMPSGSTLYVLGDLCVCSNPRYVLDTLRQVKMLYGHTMHLVFGNHDVGHSMHRGSRKVQREYLKVFDTVGDSAVLKWDKEKILLNHFPYSGDHTEEDRHSQWRLPDLGAKLIHGHTHQATPTVPERLNQVCVSWEAWRRPAPFNLVMAKFEEVADE